MNIELVIAASFALTPRMSKMKRKKRIERRKERNHWVNPYLLDAWTKFSEVQFVFIAI